MADITTVAALYLLYTSQKRRKTTRHHVWVHEVLRRRTELGEFHCLLQELRLDGDRFQRYLRLTGAQFEVLLAQVGARISRLDTNYRRSISAAERLSICLRYDIKALIGRGTFSRVVRVEHRATRQPFAIKMMEVEAPEGREVCAAELAVLQRVSHSNVIQLMEVFQFPQRVYMVLELATGGELLDRVVSRGHYTERDATRALQMVLAGVGYLHNLAITHRDLKPENLLYYHPGADSRLLVTDFGLATSGSTGAGSEDSVSDRTWSLRTTCGTPEYLAPEVLLRKPYSCAVDMWAVGVIAYIVLSGSMPFEDDSRTRLYRSIVRGKYSFHGDPWPSVSNRAKDFIQQLLQLDPATRLTADRAIHHPWVVTMAASSSMKNLHRSISQNLMRQRASRSSSRCPSRTTASTSGSSSVGPGRQISQLD